jgi:hypothetical protein
MNLKRKAHFWAIIAGPLLLPAGSAVLVYILSCVGAYVAANSPEKAMQHLLTVSATTFVEFASKTTPVFHPR